MVQNIVKIRRQQDVSYTLLEFHTLPYHTPLLPHAQILSPIPCMCPMFTYCQRQICFWLCMHILLRVWRRLLSSSFDKIMYLSWLRSYVILIYYLCLYIKIHTKKISDSNYSPTEIGSPCCRNTENPERKWFSSICRRMYMYFSLQLMTYCVLRMEKQCYIISNKR